MLIFAILFAMICWYVDVHNLQANPYWLTTKNINSLIFISTIIKFFLFFRPGFLKQEKKRVCSIFIFYSAWLLYKMKPWISLHDFDTQSKTQGRSEGTSSVPFEVLIINCQIYFINLFIFNCLTLNIKLFIFKLFDVNFCFQIIMPFANRRERLFMELWMRVLSFGF